MQIFYAPGINGSLHTLDENESRHIIRVLRMRKGMAVRLIDGRGNLYEGEIEDDSPRNCTIRIKNVIKDFEKRKYRLHIAISPLKNADRLEWFAEKSVELGVDEITPIICRNTEKQAIKTGRMTNIIISAMKQSLKATMPLLSGNVDFSDFISAKRPGKLMIAHCNPLFGRKNISEVYMPGEDAVILIGPEGDFSEDEIKEALGRGYRSIHLGNSRLRTETAGIAACHSVYFINQ